MKETITIRTTGAPFPQPAPAPVWERAMLVLADHLVVTATRGTLALVVGEISLRPRGLR